MSGIKPWFSISGVSFFPEKIKSILTFSGLVFGVLSFFYLIHAIHANHNLLLNNRALKPNQIRILGELSVLNKHLIACENLAKIQAIDIDALKNLPQQIRDLQIALKTWQSANHVGALVNAVKAANQTFLIKRSIKSKKHYKSSTISVFQKHLPFQVLDVQIWNGAPMVTIAHQGHLVLLGQQDKYAGWRLVKIDIESHEALFQRSSQCIKVVTE